MKKNSISPILELSFAAGIMLILALPFAVKAQDHKEFMVNINNSDTTINGKNIKDLSAADRKDALKKLSELNDHISITMQDGDGGRILVKRKGGQNSVVTIDRRGANGLTPMANAYSMTLDSTGKEMVIANMVRGDGDMAPKIAQGFSLSRTMGGNGRGYSTLIMSGGRKNSQNFSYSNTDKDGISTHINFTVSDASAEKVKKIAGTETTDLNIQDLNIAQSFSTGKTTLSFTLANKAAADVQFKDSEGAVLWEGKATGAEFKKSFVLPKNGVYYLQVKQAGKLALRKITKEE
ncbi:hypothetical protein ACFGVR_03225 [Mucilaginibacter sp. AW1-3]